jgi:serine/threonine-protein kinase
MLLTTIDTSGVAHLVATTIDSETAAALGAAVTGWSPGAPVRVGDYLGAATPLVTAGSDTVGMLVGFRSRQQAMAAVDPLGTSTLLGFLVGLGLALGAGLLLSRRIAAPIRTLVKATRAAREGNYAVTLPGHAPREISELARAFHGLLDELKAKEELVSVLQHERSTRELAVPAASTIQVGSLFAGRYQIAQLLGTGGMGSVYRAIDRELGDTVALKALRTDLAEGSEALDRFREEIRLARRISHRNVVRTHDLGLVGDVYYLTMELVDGRPLDDILAQEGRLTRGAAHAIGVQMLRALEAAHDVGVVHRDIKPPNLLLERAGLLKVTDFGIARLADETTRQKKLTQTGLIVGTPMYMAPEQLAGESVDARADVYAAGAVLYECVTGVSPHDGLTLPQLFLRAHQDAPPLDPRARAPETPEALAMVIVRALMPRREKRWGSAAAMIEALQGAE